MTVTFGEQVGLLRVSELVFKVMCTVWQVLGMMGEVTLGRGGIFRMQLQLIMQHNNNYYHLLLIARFQIYY